MPNSSPARYAAALVSVSLSLCCAYLSHHFGGELFHPAQEKDHVEAASAAPSTNEVPDTEAMKQSPPHSPPSKSAEETTSKSLLAPSPCSFPWDCQEATVEQARPPLPEFALDPTLDPKIILRPQTPEMYLDWGTFSELLQDSASVFN